ncbi:MAG: acyl-CoA/acyl-ACP dehydrogenase [Planctomycetes bacterium]|nr:acyl-CoA/acyl-ACP dehydrogenase [Planctomycetota bacterium]
MFNHPESLDQPALDRLCQQLAGGADAVDARGDWPRDQLGLCREAGLFRWFTPRRWGGLEWSEESLLAAYLRLSASCLTTTFILTQWHAACRRILASENLEVQRRLGSALAEGSCFVTVGISHLTTSRRHVARPVLAAKESMGGFVFDGFSPWVTGAVHADVIVTGATLHDRREVLVALPTDLPGVDVQRPAELVGLSASCTGEVHLHQVPIERTWLLAGPVENVIRAGGGGAGGLQTSALAIGLASAAIEQLEAEAQPRPELSAATEELRRDQRSLESDLFALARGEQGCTAEEVRARANSLALRATQSHLAAAKGTGYLRGHRASRWCREALFFLVWSCPQPVMAANLCEFAGLAD